ncbi:O-Glycosyl hydrolases family 17 protein isoform 3 [Hibiscus syriacus]|uniref:glucan endo-1,3-beta-D-glucosidase n=1 Tax=Hibiscus syriacus TaxID=106335 RepID=A0A6A3DA53_HIBSY|nr:O-Glycosyl hydrolases family 17 protein isoform 3 [Hibiscus syriacus]
MGSRCLKLLFAFSLLLQLLDLRRGNKAGVAYGRDGDDLPSPDRVAQTVPVIRRFLALKEHPPILPAHEDHPHYCRIKVSTPLSFGVLSKSFPPSEGAFRSSLAYVLNPLLEFLDENQSPFMIKKIDYRYKNRLAYVQEEIRLGTPAMHSGVGYVLDTPAMPGRELDVYIFSLFNENNKTGAEIEGNWGIFYPDMSAVCHLNFSGTETNSNGRSWSNNFPITFSFCIIRAGHGNCNYNVKSSDPNGRTWCIASKKASRTDLQNALDWASGPGKADCSSIQPNQQCFEPNTLLSHASFAFNNYYQKNGATDASCSFRGNAIKVGQDPTKSILFQINSPAMVIASIIVSTNSEISHVLYPCFMGDRMS